MSSQSGAVALADVVSRGVAVQWFEGVAILQEVCTAIVEGGRVVPADLGSISISADGSVSVRPGSRGDEPVLQLGTVLNELIAHDAQIPPPLRLCISQATARPPMFASVREFADGLKYFERPDGPAHIRAVYQRYVAAPPMPVPPVPAASDARRTVEQPRKEVKEPRRQASGSNLPYVLVAALAAMVAVGVLVGRQHLFEAQAAATEEGAAEEPSAPPKGAASRRASPPSPGTTTQASVSPAVDDSATISGAPGSDRLLPTWRVPEIERWVALETARGGDETEPSEVARRPISVYEQAEVIADQVYSSADPHVTAPVMIYPQLPAVPPDVTDADRVNALEVVIDVDGTVQRVRLISQPLRMTDMMLLSAARNWRFSPATLAGTPVRYRTSIRWAVPFP